jgi:hypothetical protein
MQLRWFAKSLAATVFACGSSPPPTLPVEPPLLVGIADPVNEQPPGDASLPPDAEIPPDAAPPPAIETTRYAAVSPAEIVLALAKRPAGTVQIVVGYQTVLAPEKDLCPGGDLDCKPWPDGDYTIAFITARRRVTRARWRDLEPQLRLRERQLGAAAETDPYTLTLRRLIAGETGRTLYWYADGVPVADRRRDRDRHDWTLPVELRLRGDKLPLDEPLDPRGLPGVRVGHNDADSAAKRIMEQARPALWGGRYRGSLSAAIVRELANGHLVTFLHDERCTDSEISREASVVVANGSATAAYVSEPWMKRCWNPGGRRPAGLVDHPARPGVRAALEELAYLEAASVVAFERLAVELAALGAPVALCTRARRAARDEARHASIVGALAGGIPKVEIAAVPPRGAFDLALDNAVAGCVHEAFAAVVCAYQALAATDRAVASAMAELAGDEARHGELAWAIARWLEPRLTPGERARIDAARRAALDELCARPAVLDEATARALGVPHHAQTALAAAFRARLHEVAA